jgi:hypothetical protein
MFGPDEARNRTRILSRCREPSSGGSAVEPAIMVVPLAPDQILESLVRYFVCHRKSRSSERRNTFENVRHPPERLGAAVAPPRQVVAKLAMQKQPTAY